MGGTVGAISFVEQAAHKQEEVLQDGLVILRDFIPVDLQQELVDTCFEIGKGDDRPASGFYYMDSGYADTGQRVNTLKLNQERRGRVILPVATFPEVFGEVCASVASRACELSPSLGPLAPTTVLLNFYNNSGHFKWHRDSENPALLAAGNPKPIVSLTIGNSCNFLYKLRSDDPESSLVLGSGDALVFGGPARLMLHSVGAIIPHSTPNGLRMPCTGRLNITFREVDGFLDESQFPAYRVLYDIE
eukprot:gene2169-3085_t